MTKQSLKNFEKKINITFNDFNILKQSLTHKSKSSSVNNEKLEFLGDRVLGLVLAKTLLRIYPNDSEGIIDKKFANLVNKKTCTKIAKKLSLNNFIFLGETFDGKKEVPDKIISDALEALIGGILIDRGMESAEKFILTQWKDLIKKSNYTAVDSKTKLQEYTLKKFKVLPQYKTFKRGGLQHNPIFKVEVQIPQSKKYLAKGNSIKKAEQNAAKKLIDDLKI